jgi:hypothetical protein
MRDNVELLFVMGGWPGYASTYDSYSAIQQDAWVLYVSQMVWAPVYPPADFVFSIGAAASTVEENGLNMVYCLGGFVLTHVTNSFTALNLDIGQGLWSNINAANSPSLYLHTMTGLNGTLVVFGGYNALGNGPASNTLFSYNFATSTWSVVGVPSSPPARSGHVAMAAQGVLFVMAGCGGNSGLVGQLHNLGLCYETLTDMWAFRYTTSGCLPFVRM